MRVSTRKMLAAAGLAWMTVLALAAIGLEAIAFAGPDEPPEPFCEDCDVSGYSLDTPFNYPGISFVITAEDEGPGDCEPGAVQCLPTEAGCTHTVTDVFVRGGPLGVQSLPVTAVAEARCGSSGTGTATHLGGTLTVRVVCDDCPEPF